MLCRIWSLPHTANNTAVVHSVAELKSVFDLLYCRFFKLVSVALNHDSNLLVQSVFRFSHVLTSLAIFLYVFRHVKQYSDYESKIVRELRTTCIPGFDQSELDVLGDYISTIILLLLNLCWCVS